MQVRILSSVEEICEITDDWNALWKQSDLAMPTLRAELLLAWLEDFAPSSRLRAITVFDGDRLAAALPLIDSFEGVRGKLRASKLGLIGELPNNYWTLAGDLMVDPECDFETAAEAMASVIDQLPWSLLMLRLVQVDRPAWRALLGAIRRRNLALHRYDMYEVGTIDFPDSAGSYFAERSRRHVKNMRRAERQLANRGDKALRYYDHLTSEEVESLLKEGFLVEDRSWKGRAGTSVVRARGIWDHYLKQAKLLASAGELRLAFLDCDGQAVAFEYGAQAKGRYFSPKAGYDEAFAECSPSQLLCNEIYSSMADASDPPVVDLVGPLNDAERKWTNGSYSLSSVMISTGSVVGSALLSAIVGVRKVRAKLRSRS